MIIQLVLEICVRKRKISSRLNRSVYNCLDAAAMFLYNSKRKLRKLVFFVGISVPRMVTSNGFWYQLWRKLSADDDFLVKDGFNSRNGMSSFFTACIVCGYD